MMDHKNCAFGAFVMKAEVSMPAEVGIFAQVALFVMTSLALIGRTRRASSLGFRQGV